MKKYFVLSFLCLMLFLSACSNADPRQDALVAHMEQTGVKMYGAFWCGHCADQKDILGSHVKDIYVECDARGKNEQAELCIEKDIKGYPTFELANGTMVSGVHSIDELIELTGFES